MKARIIQVTVAPYIKGTTYLHALKLEDQLATQPPPAKRARKSAASTAPAEDTSSTLAGPSNATGGSLSKAEEKKRKMQFKKIFDRYAIL